MKPTRSLLGRAAYAAAVLLIVYLAAWPVPIDPIAWEPPPDSRLAGVFEANAALADIEYLVEVGPGPEDMAMGPDRLIYTGLDDGRIVRFDPDSDAPAETFVDTGGRPLGMEFGLGGALLVADAFRGLLSVAPDGEISVLVDSIDGERLLFVNDLDVAIDGTIWFTDSSRRFDQRQYMLDMMESRATGRLLSHDPASGETRVWLDDLRFANGVATGPWGSYVWVAELLEARIHELVVDIDGPVDSRILIDALPGYPDNLSWNNEGVIWIAVPAVRNASLEGIAGSPFLRKVILRLPELAMPAIEPYSFVLGIDHDGNVVHNLQDPSGGYPNITSVKEIDGYLYFGSIMTNAIGRISLPDR